MDNKKYKTILILGGVAVLICFGSSFYFIFNNFKGTDDKVNKDMTKTEMEMEELIDNTIGEEEKNSEDFDKDSVLSELLGDSKERYDTSLKLGDKDNPEMKEKDSNVFYSNLILKAQTANFEEIIDEINDKKSKYKFHEDYNWKITNLYYDSTLMLETLNMEEEDRGFVIKNMKDPNMLLICTLYAPEKSRRDVITDINSLSPIFDGTISIKNHTITHIEDEFTDEYLDNILNETFSIENIHIFDFEVENNPLKAYIVEHTDGSLEFFSIIQDGDYELIYKPISFWEKVNP